MADHNNYPTAHATILYSVEERTPPTAKKLVLLTKYGVLVHGPYKPGFYTHWGYLPKKNGIDPDAYISRLEETLAESQEAAQFWNTNYGLLMRRYLDRTIERDKLRARVKELEDRLKDDS